MSAKAATVDEITKSFIFPSLPKHSGIPIYETIAATHAKLKVNASRVPSPLGGGQFGHLGLVISPVNYLTIANEQFDCPANPGIHHNIPAGAIAAQIVDEQFIKSLHNRNTGYVTSSTWDILDFLYRNYGNITPAQLVENTSKLTEPFNPAEPIENLYTRFEDAMEFAEAANRPYTSEQILEYALLSSKPQTPIQNPPNNGPVHVECTLLHQVVAAASEAELGANFINAQKAIPVCQALLDMGHPQPPTPIKTDNSTAHGILTSLVKQKRSKAFYMHFYWLKDRIAQQQFQVYWKPGKQNLADYVTKHHPPTHHRIMRPKYLLNLVKSVALMQGCVTPFPTTDHDQWSQCINTIVK